ncbi:hypothetical protein PQX77_021556 [Marasmius sp. AFHP31]|nr:hypothetical protein PQX77_021556 [Marasmius sp. AFHP31]
MVSSRPPPSKGNEIPQRIDPKLHIDYEDAQGKSIGVFLSAKGNEDEDDIPPGTTGISSYRHYVLEWSRLSYLIPRKVVRIPKKSALSVKSSGLTKYLGNDYAFAPHGLETQLELTFAVYLEDSKGSLSPWHLYLKSLPEKAVDLPMFWATEVVEEEGRDEDVKMALGWMMMGSEIYGYLIPLNNVREFFYDTVVSTMNDAATTKPSLRAYLLLPCLLPRVIPPNSTYAPTAESLRQCIHDRELEPPSSEADEEELYYTMTTTTYGDIDTHPSRTEIFNPLSTLDDDDT